MGPHQRRSRRATTVVQALLVVVVSLAIWVVTSIARGGADPVAVAGLVVTVVALVFQVASFFRDAAASGSGRPSAVEADELADVLQQEWRGEVEARRLRSPRILPLEWAESRRPVSDSSAATPFGASSAVTVSLKLSGRLESSFDDATRMLAAGYLRIPTKRLVILGEPGAGKSVLALLLGLGLLAARTPGRPVAVLLPVSSWDPLSHNLNSWIVQYLAISYYNGDTTAPKALLRDGLLLPILDGLDEIPETLRRTATREINRAVNWDQGVVLSCRSAEYQELIEGGAPALRRAPVVEVLPVAPADAVDYLRSMHWPADVRWDGVYRNLGDASGGPLAQALSTPLMVGFARTVYERLGGRPEELVDEERFSSRHAVEEYLTDKVVDAAYAAPASPQEETASPATWTAADARRWLTFLARHMQRHRERELMWWRLAPRYLKWWLGPVVGIAFGLLTAAVVLIPEVVLGWSDSEQNLFVAEDLIYGVPVAVVLMVVWFAAEGRPPGRLSPTRRGSMERFRRGFPAGAVAVVAVALPVLTVYVLALLLSGSWTARAVESLYATTVVLVLLTGVAGLVTAADTWASSQSSGAGPATPGLMFRQDRKLAWLGSAVPALVAALLVLPAVAGGLVAGALLVRGASGWSGWPGRPDAGAVASSVLIGTGDVDQSSYLLLQVLLGILLVGTTVYFAFLLSRAWSRFVIFRLVMAARRRLPWGLPRFLDDARTRGVLRQTAGAYQFSHARLQENLANAPARPDQSSRLASSTPRRRPQTVVVAVAAAAVVALPFVTLPVNIARSALPIGGTDFGPLPYKFSADGRYLVASTEKRTVTIWNVEAGQKIGEFEGEFDSVERVDLSPDARLLALKLDKSNTGLGRGPVEVVVWDIARGQVLVRDVVDVAVLAGGRAVVTFGSPSPAGQQRAELWDTAMRKPVRELAGAGDGHRVTLSPAGTDAERILSVDDSGRPALFAAPNAVATPLRPLDGVVSSPAFDPSGTLIVASTTTGIRVWRAADVSLVTDLPITGAARVVGVPAVERMIVTSGRPVSAAADSAAFAVHDTATGGRIDGLDDTGGFAAPSLGPDGSVVALVRPERGDTVLVDTASGRPTTTLPGRAAFVRSEGDDGVAVPLLLESIDVKDPRRTVDLRVWTVDGTPRATLRTSRVSAGDVQVDHALPVGTSGEEYLNLAVAPDGRAAAAVELGAAGMPSTLRLYDLQSSRVREVPGELAPGSSAQGVSRFSPDGSIFAAAYEEQLDLWDIRADQIRRIPDRLPPLGWQSRTFQFSADGATMTTAAAAHVDKEPRVWGTRTGRMLGALSGHSGGVAAVYYGGDGTIRTVGERDGTVRVYAVPG